MTNEDNLTEDQISEIIKDFKFHDKGEKIEFLIQNSEKMSPKQKYHLALILYKLHFINKEYQVVEWTVSQKVRYEVIELLSETVEEYEKSKLYLKFFGDYLHSDARYEKADIFYLYDMGNNYDDNSQSKEHIMLRGARRNPAMNFWHEAVSEAMTIAKQGVPPAQLLLAEAYRAGKGVPKSSLHALTWATIAQINGMHAGEIICDEIEKELGALGAEQREKANIKAADMLEDNIELYEDTL